MKSKNLMQTIDIDENLKNIYYDLAGNPNIETIKFLLSITTIDHIFYGSDYPYQPDTILIKNLKNLENLLEGDFELKKYKNDILYKNVEKLLFNDS